MGLILSPFFDPAHQHLLLGVRQRLLRFRRRHPLRFVLRQNPSDHLAAVGVARLDRPHLHGDLTLVQPQVSLPRVQAAEARARAQLRDADRFVMDARVALATVMGVAADERDLTLPQAADRFPDEGNGQSDPASLPPTITRGMTVGQVINVLGTPKDVVDMGFRKIFQYDNLRVTFLGGRVVDAR